MGSFLATAPHHSEWTAVAQAQRCQSRPRSVAADARASSDPRKRVLYCLARRSCSGLAKACEQFKDLLGSRNSSSRDVQALKIACPSTEIYRPSLVQALSKPSNFLSKRDSLGRFRVGILSKPLPRAPSL